jgi:hypothetical protein
MKPVDQSRRKRPRPTGRRDGLLLPIAALLALTGCQGGYGSKQGDPFMGVHAPPMPASSAGGTAVSPVGGTQTASNTPPSLPGSFAVPNQAALASGTTQTPDDPRDLRIKTPPLMQVTSSDGTARGAAPSNIQVGGPEPMPESTSKTVPTPVASAGIRPPNGAVAPPPPVGIATVEQALQYLKQKGVVWWRLDGDRGQCKFQCALPNPGSKNKGLNRIYEIKATDSLSAVRAVIDQIEKEQR